MNYRVVYVMASFQRNNERRVTFTSENLSEAWANIVLRDVQEIAIESRIEVHLPTINIWAPMGDAEVLRKYLGNSKELR